MSEGTKIQWCDDTHNFWRGCVKVSPGCAHCYAEVSTPVRVARSKGRELWGGTLRDRAKDFDAPLRWNRKPWICEGCGHAHETENWENDNESCCPDRISLTKPTRHRRRVFSLSLGDWLDEAVPIEWLADMLDVIRQCPNLDFLLLTKRPENFKPRLMEAAKFWKHKISLTPLGDFDIPWYWLCDWLSSVSGDFRASAPKPPANVWIGCTVENQEYADKRIPELLEIPAVCRFLSYEPALGPICFTQSTFFSEKSFRKDIHWVIVGGESGPKARPFNIEWARSTVAQCRAAGVACFVKQMGRLPWMEVEGAGAPMELPDKKGGSMEEWPEDLRVREFPKSLSK
jgi:protein gp37